MVDSVEYRNDDELLLLDFNKRKKSAFSIVYIRFFRELNHFAAHLFYRTGIDSEDLIQDIFIAIWSNKNPSFISLDHIKSYIYISIKNKHKNFIKSKIPKQKFEQVMEYTDKYQFSCMVEAETFSLLSFVERFLPTECARVMKLYLEGYEMKEIAEKLNKSLNTIYHQRDEGVKVLKKHINIKKIDFFLYFFQIIWQ